MSRGLVRQLLRGRWALVVAAGACMVASAVGIALAVRLSGAVVDDLLAGLDARDLAVAALVFGVLSTVLWSAADLIINRLATGVAVRLRALMVRHTFSLPLSFFTDRSVGEVTDRMSTDVDTVATGVLNQVKPIAMGVLGATVAMLMSLTVDVRLTLLFIPAAIAIGWTGARSGRRVALDARAQQAEWAEAAGTAEEAFGAREDLRQALGRGLVMRRWAEHGSRVWGHVVRLGKSRNRLTLSTTGMLRLFQLAVLATGAMLAVRGDLGAGDVWAAFALVTLFSRRIDEVLSNLTKVTELMAAGQRIAELMDEAPEPSTTVAHVRGLAPPDAEACGARSPHRRRGPNPTAGVACSTPNSRLPQCEPAGAATKAAEVRWDQPVPIEFDHVDFAYGDGPTVLHDVTLSIRAGRSVAVVGRTGSGKSTLARLVNRAVDTPPRSVRLDGIDVCGVELDVLRRHVGVVSQRVELLRATIRDNVTLFDPSITDERIAGAFEHLGLTRWLADLPDGVDTRLGDGATVLSSGEEQLVAFARLLVRDPAIVILDEATARLDPGTEALLQAATDRLLAGRTSIIIAHRLATIAGVDDVVVLDQGRVVEHGSRRDLLADPGSEFRQLVEAAGGLEVHDVIERHEQRGPIRAAFEAAGDLETDGIDAEPRASNVPSVASTTWHLACRHPRMFIPGTLGWMVFFTAPAVTAWVWASLVPQLEPGGDAWPPIAVFGIAAVVGLAGKLVGERYFSRWWMLSNITLRSNLLAAQLHPHDERAGDRPQSPGDAVSRMWDTNDFVNYTDHWVDLACALAFLVTATALSGRWATAPWLVAPVLVPLAGAWLLRKRLTRVATEHAMLRGAWSGRVAEVCAAATTVKGFAAEPHVVAHLDELTERRQRAALGQRNIELTLFGSVFFTAEIAQRVVLLLAAIALVDVTDSSRRALVSGGAVAVVEAIALMPIAGIVTCMVVGEIPMIRAKLRRMARLLPPRSEFDISQPPHDLQLPPAEPRPVPTVRPTHAPLEKLSVSGVSVIYDDGTVAIEDVSFDVERGELVIVTGPLAAGKSTLLRVLAGLCSPTGGELHWDGEPVEAPSEFLRPPNCAFVAQAPRLISGTVDENVALDHDVDVRAALCLAELDHDLDPAGGADARVGHRGLRLSGGQVQRLATARATAAVSELLVLDDLSSALDVVTERLLWQNLREAGHTVVATSYKRSALELADQIVVLRQGRVAGMGSLDELDDEFGHLFA